MDLTKILAVSGRQGLYRLLSQSPRGIIAESVSDGKKVIIFSTERISTLEEISIFTVDNDVKLKEVFKIIFEKLEGKPAISHKSSANELRKFMEEILPDYDEERVYNSDIQKLVSWYNLLSEKNLIDLESDEEVEEEESVEEEKAVKKEPKKEVKGEKKPKPEQKQVTAAKKTAAPAAKPTQRKTSPRSK